MTDLAPLPAISVDGLVVVQDPDAEETYTLDWSSRLLEGVTVSASEWDADGATIVDSAFDDTSSTAVIGVVTKAWPGHTIRVRILDSEGHPHDASFGLVSEER